MSKQEALDAARRLVKRAVEMAEEADIDPASVIEPYCPDAPAARDGGDRLDPPEMVWGGVPVTIDDDTDGLFEMPEPNGDPDQRPAFRATTSTADLVRQDFGRYKASLERMADEWREEKERVMREHAAADEGRAGGA